MLESDLVKDLSRPPSPEIAMAGASRDLTIHKSVKPRTFVRYTLALCVTLLVFAYLITIVTGRINPQERLDGTSVVLIAIAVAVATLAVNPQVLENVKSFEFGKLKFELARVREKQFEQQDQLSLIKLVLPFLLPEQSRTYLRCLLHDTKQDFRGSHDLRRELRRLAEVKLVQRLDGKSIGKEAGDGVEIKSLKTFLQLSDLGRDWLEQIEKLDKDGGRGK